MTTTLIVRDATFAINGAPEQRGDPRKHLAARIAEVGRMEERTAEECIEVLDSVAGGEGADPEVLEALVIVGLAQPALAERLSLPTLVTGRRLAMRLERDGDVDHALAIFELLARHFPEDEGLEHDRAQLSRRQGTVQDLITRYCERAEKLTREGRNSEAAGWLREVLQLDPAHKEALCMLRSLRFKHAPRGSGSGGRLRFLFMMALLGLGVAYGAMREVRLYREFHVLPQATAGNLPALKRRLDEIEHFVQRNPVWHGALQALSERSSLRVQVSVLEEQERQAQESAERAERQRLDEARLLKEKGEMYARSGDLRLALEALRQAIERGGPGWSDYDRVTHDVSDIEGVLRNQQ